MTRSTPVHLDDTPATLRTGRRFAYKSNSLRSATLMLGGPSAIAVAMGPLSATCVLRTDSTALSRGKSPTRLPSSRGSPKTSHSTETPVASIICLAASATSGPIPSPGRSVILCVMAPNILGESRKLVEDIRNRDFYYGEHPGS